MQNTVHEKGLLIAYLWYTVSIFETASALLSRWLVWKRFSEFCFAPYIQVCRSLQCINMYWDWIVNLYDFNASWFDGWICCIVLWFCLCQTWRLQATCKLICFSFFWFCMLLMWFYAAIKIPFLSTIHTFLLCVCHTEQPYCFCRLQKQ